MSAQEYQLADRWVTDEISVLEISFLKNLEYMSLKLRNYKKLKRTKIAKF